MDNVTFAPTARYDGVEKRIPAYYMRVDGHTVGIVRKQHKVWVGMLFKKPGYFYGKTRSGLAKQMLA